MRIAGAFPQRNPPLHIVIRYVVSRMYELCALHRDPLLRRSATRLEQLRDSEGPPPLDVPKKVMDIGRGAMTVLWDNVVVI